MSFTLPDLPYSYNALEPHMSAETLEFHHDKHHKAYVDKANELIEGSGLENMSLEDALKAAHDDPSKAGLFNQLGQHYNHSHFWEGMKENGGGTNIPASLETKINEDLGGYAEFKTKFIEAGMTQFGSGWCWLSLDNATGKLEISKTGNGHTPLAHGKTPLLTCDVWEHAYYIDNRNARPKFLETFVDNLINWDKVKKRFEQANG